MACVCGCCKGACCTEAGCSQKLCAECAAEGGKFQGNATPCDGPDCPCDPPAWALTCQRCANGETVGTCDEADCCIDGQCKPCPPPTCYPAACTSPDCCVDGYCRDCPPFECPESACPEGECCVDGYCITCPDYGCTGTEECGEGECCVNGECVPCDDCSPGSCPEGECCVEGKCYPCPPNDDPCTPGTCPNEGDCCVDGYCVPCPPPECPDPLCPTGQCCVDGMCMNPCPEGENCCDGNCQAWPCGSDCSGACADAVTYAVSSPPGVPETGLVSSSIQTITVPAGYTLPVTVCFSAAADDGLAINGVRISNFGESPPPFCIEDPTFDAGVWNDVGPWAINGKFCFVEGCNPLP